jgi:hypothetical protein
MNASVLQRAAYLRRIVIVPTLLHSAPLEMPTHQHDKEQYRGDSRQDSYHTDHDTGNLSWRTEGSAQTASDGDARNW